MTYKIAALPQTLVDPLWPNLEPHLARVVELVSDETSLEIVKQKAISGEVLILVVVKGPDIIAVLTGDIRDYDTGLKVMHIGMLGGDDFFEWRNQMQDVLVAISMDFCCDQVRIVGRKGWQRALKDIGWEEQYTVMKFDTGYNK